MKIESVAEQRERMLREHADKKVPGRTLPRNCQWTGLDQPGCGAAKRRLRQVEALLRKKVAKTSEAFDAQGEKDAVRTLLGEEKTE